MATDNYITCDNKNLSFEDIIKSLLTVDENGCAAIRFVQVTDSGNPFINCNNNSLSVEGALKNAISLDDNGNPAIRLALTT